MEPSLLILVSQIWTSGAMHPHPPEAKITLGRPIEVPFCNLVKRPTLLASSGGPQLPLEEQPCEHARKEVNDARDDAVN